MVFLFRVLPSDEFLVLPCLLSWLRLQHSKWRTSKIVHDVTSNKMVVFMRTSRHVSGVNVFLYYTGERRRLADCILWNVWMISNSELESVWSYYKLFFQNFTGGIEESHKNKSE